MRADSGAVIMSGRGTMTSRTTVSPNSKMEWISSFSSSSIDESSSEATSAIARISCSVANGPSGSPRPGSTTLAMPTSRCATGPNGAGDGDDDRRQPQRHPVGVLDREGLGRHLREDEQDQRHPDRRYEFGPAVQVPGHQDRGEGRAADRAHQRQQEHDVQVRRDVLHDLLEGLRPAPALLGQPVGPRAPGPRDRHLGRRQEARRPGPGAGRRSPRASRVAHGIVTPEYRSCRSHIAARSPSSSWS